MLCAERTRSASKSVYACSVAVHGMLEEVHLRSVRSSVASLRFFRAGVEAIVCTILSVDDEIKSRLPATVAIGGAFNELSRYARNSCADDTEGIFVTRQI